MRKGQNPAKLGIPAYTPHRLGAAVLTYIPALDGYFAESLAVMKATIASLRQNTGEPFDLLVFDNGSCPEARQLLTDLQEQGQIDWLMLSSHNMGKTGALNWIIASLPNELICYTDSDVFFRPGWYQASLAVLEAFDKAGMVAAQPCFFDVLHGAGQAGQAVDVSTGIKIDSFRPPEQVVAEYCGGIDASPEMEARYHAQVFTRLTRSDSGVQALLGASHMQFLARADALRRVLPLPAARGLDQAEDRLLDQRIDDLGLLHLATPVAYVFHIGNSIDEAAAAEIGQLSGQSQPQGAVESFNVPALVKLAAALPGGRQRLRRLYNELYQFFVRDNRPS